ncbi:Hypothetical protein CINCED_3A013258, partial [Cinara cedri]
SFGVVCFALRDISKGELRKVVTTSKCSGSGFMFGWGVNVSERWPPKKTAFSLSEITNWPFGPYRGVDCSLILRMSFVVLHKEPSSVLSD